MKLIYTKANDVFKITTIEENEETKIPIINNRYPEVHPWVPVTTAWRVPWVVDGGVGLQIWRLAANILNKQSWTAGQEWSSSLGV